jgi:hypothetical protein
VATEIIAVVGKGSAMTTTLNILHLLMLLAVLGCAFFGLREAKGAPLLRRH